MMKKYLLYGLAIVAYSVAVVLMRHSEAEIPNWVYWAMSFVLIAALGCIGSTGIDSEKDEPVDQTAENVRSASVKMASGSSVILEEMGKLRTSLEAVQKSMSDMSENARDVVTSGMKLDHSVEELDVNVTQLSSDVAKFRTE